MATDQITKFCVDCKWVEKDRSDHVCTHPRQLSIDPVTGAAYKVTCRNLRTLGTPCGYYGELWEAKDA